MYKTKAKKTKAKVLTKPEDILREGNLKQVKKMYEAADKNGEIIHFERNRTALHYAAQNQDLMVLLYLLKERRLNPNLIDDLDVVPLDWAIHDGNINNIKLLIEYKADFERKDKTNLSIIDALEGYGYYKKVDAVKEIIAAARQKKQQEKVAQTSTSVPVVSRRRGDSHSSSESDSVTEHEISSNTSSSPSSSSLVTTFFEKIGGLFGSSPGSSPEKEALLPFPSKKLKNN